MEADVKSFIGFLAPLAIAYMTWSSVTSNVAALKGAELKTINVGQLGTAPKLPSAATELRDPFTPEGAVSAALAAAAASARNGAAKEDQPLHLDGTVIAGKLRFAIINGVRVIEGDYFRGLRLEKVEVSRVTLKGGSKETVLPLEVAKSDAIEIAAPTAAVASPGSERPARLARAESSDDAPKGSAGGTGRPLPSKMAAPKAAGAKRMGH